MPSVSVSLVSTDPDPAIAGDVMEARLSISNVGDTAANDIVVTIEPRYPFEAIPGIASAQTIGTSE